ncbi:AAA family ATPase [Rugamonas sp. A1-17]|nr:AAA family ATPase [Rugamonas sp. A1-17]
MPFKIVIDNVASYKTPATLESDKKVTLVYGLNGSGKSTISNFLYKPEAPAFNSCSRQGFENANVLVYNLQFVKDNFFEIDNLSGIFTLSKVNKDVEVKISSLSAELKKLNSDRGGYVERNDANIKAMESLLSAVEDQTWKIKTTYSGGDRVLEYCLDGLKTKSKLYEHISNLALPDSTAVRQIDLIKKDVEALQGDNARSYSLIPSAIADKTGIEKNQILKKIIIGKSDSPVAELISMLGNADWVKKGLEYVEKLRATENDACPFCQKATLTPELTKVIQDYFDKTFNDSIEELNKLEQQYNLFVAHQPELITHFDNPFFVDFVSEFKALYSQLESYWASNKEKIQQKIKSPSAPVDLIPTDKLVNDVNDISKKVNKLIDEHNLRISDKKAALAKLKTEFWDRCRIEYDAAISAHATANSTLITVKGELGRDIKKIDDEISSKKTELVELQQKTVNVDAAIGSINSRLEAMGIDSFKIVKIGENRYRLSRNGMSADDFQTLSEGEKTVISFIYFIELCKGKRSPDDVAANKIAVIDDPISSLSHIYVFHIGQLIKEEFSNSSDFSHVLVLTHSLYFFYELTDIKKDRREATQKLARIIKNSTGSSIVEMKYEEIQNDYQAYWNVIMDENQHPALIANCMRNIIEYFFNFVRKRDLNNVFQMPVLKDMKHQAFCRYMNRESHSIGQNLFDYKEFDYERFKEAFKIVFQEAGFPEHYAAMTK